MTSISSATAVIPVYMNEESLSTLCDQLDGLDVGAVSLNIIFVVDGSPDRSADLIRDVAPRMQRSVVLIELSRNFGSFAAIREGLRRSSSDITVVIAADLQEPSDLIPRFITLIKESGYDLVLGHRTARSDPWFTRLTSALFWNTYRRFVQPEMPPGGVDTFGINRPALEALLDMEDQNTSLVGQLLWIGFNRSYVPYARQARHSGRSAWTMRKKMRYMFDSIYAFTDLPIRALTNLGVIGSASVLLISLTVLVQWALGRIDVAGYTPLMLTLLLVGFLIMFGLGVVGSYISRAFENSKKRPSAVVKQVSQF